jgi:sugar/nucleoside kinase (ribokinase family)
VTEPAFDVVGVGNALVDVLSHEPDDFLDRHGLISGSMTLVGIDRAEQLYASMGPASESSGGSAANTVAGVASFGGLAAYIGRVADDELGAVFSHDLRAGGVVFRARAADDGPPTGRCLVVITPDGQRTMSTYLGTSALFGPDELDAELIAGAAVTYLEGYLWDLPPAKEAYRTAARLAHDAGRRAALTLSDRFCVERHRAEWRALVHDGVDIVFANEDEITSLYETTSYEEAVAHVRAHCEVACLTRGASGSEVVTPTERHRIEADPVAHVVDTTGAGDMYAAGFLYGFTHGYDLPACGRLGSLAAAAIIGHTGARPETPFRELTGRVAG